MTATCPYCERPFAPRQKTQEFCSPEHKAAFWNGCRLLGFDLFRSGAVNPAVIRMHSRNSGQEAVNAPLAAKTVQQHEGEAN